MSRKRPSWHLQNKKALNALCKAEGYEIAWLDEYHARVLSGVCIVDIWTPRMKYNVLNIDGVEQPARYNQLAYEFDKVKVKQLLECGKLQQKCPKIVLFSFLL